MNMSYALFDDDCSVCQYLKNAFILLKLPLLSLQHENSVPSELPHAIFFCSHLNAELLAALKQLAVSRTAINLICLQDVTSQRQEIDTEHCNLPANFSLHELLAILATISAALPVNNAIYDFTKNFKHLIGISSPMLNIRNLICQVATCDTTVLISGESGTGKEVIASCIHQLSKRAHNLLVPINCGAIPMELMESELFGHEKGAFTGALSRRQGRFEIADKGTLFLDEIGDMPLSMQVKLLRVIQERKIDHVGGNNSIDIDVRLIAATNKNLEECVQKNTFREDLFYRLNVFPIHVPSLRDRKSDIPILIEYHLDKIQSRLEHRVAFTEDALAKLCDYPWPGNIRELVNFLERIVITHRDQVLTADQLPDTMKVKVPLDSQNVFAEWNGDVKFDIKNYMANLEQRIIKTALEQSEGMVSRAAENLSLRRTTLIEKMKKYNITVSQIPS